jgi:hypothetical protein
VRLLYPGQRFILWAIAGLSPIYSVLGTFEGHFRGTLRRNFEGEFERKSEKESERVREKLPGIVRGKFPRGGRRAIPGEVCGSAGQQVLGTSQRAGESVCKGSCKSARTDRPDRSVRRIESVPPGRDRSQRVCQMVSVHKRCRPRILLHTFSDDRRAEAGDTNIFMAFTARTDCVAATGHSATPSSGDRPRISGKRQRHVATNATIGGHPS